MTIAVADGSLATLDRLREQYEGVVHFRSGDVSTPDAVAELTEGAVALVVTLHRLTADHVAALGDTVEVIGRAGVGLDTVDVDAAAGRGVRVLYQPSYATNEVADHALALLLAAQRRIVQADGRLRADGWAGGHDLGPVLALHDATAGVIGTGRIGRAVAARLRPMAAEVLGFDPAAPEAPEGVTMVDSLDDLLRRSHVVTLHSPLSPATRHLIGARELALLPTGAVLVNVSRGGLVDEQALVDALGSGQLGAAALDVFETEPLPESSPLRTAPNLVLTPHIAWYSSQAGVRLADWTVADVVDLARGREPGHGAIAVPSSSAVPSADPSAPSALAG